MSIVNGANGKIRTSNLSANRTADISSKKGEEIDLLHCQKAAATTVFIPASCILICKNTLAVQ